MRVWKVWLCTYRTSTAAATAALRFCPRCSGGGFRRGKTKNALILKPFILFLLFLKGSLWVNPLNYLTRINSTSLTQLPNWERAFPSLITRPKVNSVCHNEICSTFFYRGPGMVQLSEALFSFSIIWGRL